MFHLMRAATCAITLALATPAQSASFQFFGTASGNTSTGQQLAVSGTPRIGTTFTLGVTYATPPFVCLQVLTPYAVWLTLGTSNQSWQGIPLPVALPALQMMIALPRQCRPPPIACWETPISRVL